MAMLGRASCRVMRTPSEPCLGSLQVTAASPEAPQYGHLARPLQIPKTEKLQNHSCDFKLLSSGGMCMQQQNVEKL